MFWKWLTDLWDETSERWLFLTGLAGSIITFFPLNLQFSVLRWTAAALAIISFGVANFKLYKKLQENLVDEKADERRRNFKVSLSIEGYPPSQTLNVEASEKIMVSRIAYLLMDGTRLASDDLRLEGDTVSVKINEGYLSRLWDAHRPDKNPMNHAGPIKLRLTISAVGRTRDPEIIAVMDHRVISNAWWKSLTGSEAFHGI